MENQNLSFGQKLVGITFNPSQNPYVHDIKTAFAQLIDLIGDPTQDTVNRSWTYNILRTAAINSLITAQMAFIKLVTWKEE
mgnify:CR=1 FL=1